MLTASLLLGFFFLGHNSIQTLLINSPWIETTIAIMLPKKRVHTAVDAAFRSQKYYLSQLQVS